MLLFPFVGLSDSRITEKVRKNFSEIWEVFKDTILTGAENVWFQDFPL